MLEAAQQRRKVSAPLRLAATALYSLLGAPSLGKWLGAWAEPGGERLMQAATVARHIPCTPHELCPSTACCLLALTLLCSAVLCPAAASAQFAALDIKSILHDSLTGHWLLPLAAAAGGEDATELRR